MPVTTPYVCFVMSERLSNARVRSGMPGETCEKRVGLFDAIFSNTDDKMCSDVECTRRILKQTVKH